MEDEKNDCTKKGVSFMTLNIMNSDEVDMKFLEYLKSLNKERFDIIFCFSVSMWIHLNYGDEGLKLFLRTVKKWCNNLVLEPQPWKCYRTASRRMRRSHQQDFQHIENIQYKCDKLLPFIIKQCEESGLKNVCSFGQTGWKRSIMLFKSVNDNVNDEN